MSSTLVPSRTFSQYCTASGCSAARATAAREAALGEPSTTEIEIDDGEVAGEELDGATMQPDLPVQRKVIDVIGEKHHDCRPVAEHVEGDTNPIPRRRITDGRRGHVAGL